MKKKKSKKRQAYLTEFQKVCMYNYRRLESLEVSRKYKNISWLLRSGSRCKYSVYEILRKFYRYASEKQAYMIDGKYIIWLTSTYMQRHWGTSKGHTVLVYASLVGLIGRVNHMSDDEMIGLCEFLSWKMGNSCDHYKDNIALWIVEKLDEEKLIEADRQIEKYRDKGITAMNVSYDILTLNGLQADADRVLPEHKLKDRSLDDKLEKYHVIRLEIEKQLTGRGYALKRDVYQNCSGITKHSFEKIWSMWIRSGRSGYQYGRPTKELRAITGSSSWVITR